MAKFNVGVGDAFPMEAEDGQSRGADRRSDDEMRDDGCSHHDGRRWRRRNRFWYVKVSAILLVIYGAMAAFGGHGPRGLLLAAAIVFGVGFITALFRDDDRPRRRDDARRSWGTR